MPATSVWLARAEAAMNRTIAESSAAGAAAARLDGRSLDIDVDGMMCVRAVVFSSRVLLTTVARAAADTDTPPDATISGSLPSLLQAALSQDAPHAQGALRVSGDAEIAAAFRTLFRCATPDFEEQVARVLGDTPARALSSFVATSLSYLRRTRRTFGENIAEYLQEESRDLVSRTEVDEFLNGVDAARDSAERVAARLAHLEQRVKGGV